MTNEITRQVEDLLRQAHTAHSVYEKDELNGVYDQAWAAWYAVWALDRLNTLLGTAFDAAGLTQLLTSLNEAHQEARASTGTSEDWAQFTARRLVEGYS